MMPDSEVWTPIFILYCTVSHPLPVTSECNRRAQAHRRTFYKNATIHDSDGYYTNQGRNGIMAHDINHPYATASVLYIPNLQFNIFTGNESKTNEFTTYTWNLPKGGFLAGVQALLLERTDFPPSSDVVLCWSFVVGIDTNGAEGRIYCRVYYSFRSYNNAQVRAPNFCSVCL